ncbi:MAG: hypothetical protein QF792_06665, partial [Phycisphaerae bacterium]|nr:hypothetical protein [Phycisphaerae bacterium]
MNSIDILPEWTGENSKLMPKLRGAGGRPQAIVRDAASRYNSITSNRYYEIEPSKIPDISRQALGC